jgi:hypothetical protein
MGILVASVVVTVMGSGCMSIANRAGVIHVTSDPPGAMIFESSVWPIEDIDTLNDSYMTGKGSHIAGNAPCSWKKAAQMPALKARWRDGAESHWLFLPHDTWGFKDASCHFERSKATIPQPTTANFSPRGGFSVTPSTANWYPLDGPRGFVEFYLKLSGRTKKGPQFLRAYQQYGSVLCTIEGFSLENEGARFRLPCQPGRNVFAFSAIGSDPDASRFIVDVKENTLSVVRMEYSGDRSAGVVTCVVENTLPQQ